MLHFAFSSINNIKKHILSITMLLGAFVLNGQLKPYLQESTGKYILGSSPTELTIYEIDSEPLIDQTNAYDKKSWYKCNLFYRFIKNRKMGLMYPDGTIILEPKFDDIEVISLDTEEGVLHSMVVLNNKKLYLVNADLNIGTKEIDEPNIISIGTLIEEEVSAGDIDRSIINSNDPLFNDFPNGYRTTYNVMGRNITVIVTYNDQQLKGLGLYDESLENNSSKKEVIMKTEIIFKSYKIFTLCDKSLLFFVEEQNGTKYYMDERGVKLVASK
jgi:hypothetical protein